MGGNCCKWLKKEAVANTPVEEVKEPLLDEGQMDNSKNRDLKGELLKAAEYGDMKSLLELLQEGADVNDAKLSDDGSTPLMLAAQYNYVNRVDLLLTEGADVNICDNEGNTALLKAADKFDSLKLLIQASVDVNVTNKTERSALMVALWEGNEKCVELLVEAGADVNHCDTEGNTLLMQAAQYGYVNCLKCLIQGNTDVNEARDDGFTALLAATRNGRGRCMEALIGAGADVNVTDSSGNTALLIATVVGDDKAVEVLAKSGSDVNSNALFGQTPLLLASSCGDCKGISALIQAGADVNSVENKTAIVRASRSRCVKAVCLLLEAGANLTTPNTDDECTACDLLGLQSNGNELALVLMAAGESTWKNYKTSGHFMHFTSTEQMNLKHLCRKVIRKCLLVSDPPINLFYKTPRLGLSSVLTGYLTYNVNISLKSYGAPTEILK